MFKLIKENKGKAVVSSVLVLLPMLIGLLLWNWLPDNMTTHWGADGVADGTGSKAFAVFAPSLILLGLHWFCLVFSLADPKMQGQSKKATGLLFWICPVISLFCGGILYTTAFGWEARLEQAVFGLLGVLFIAMGNYLPKVKQNMTFGIKIVWAMRNEENWNRTHRFGGKLWVLGGLVMLLGVFLLVNVFLYILLADVLVMAVAPMVYSYALYRKQKKAGIYIAMEQPLIKSHKVIAVIGTVIGVAVLVLLGLMMVTGDIDYQIGTEGFTIEADYYEDLTVAFDTIDSVEFRETDDPGRRTSGFGSPRLSMGVFTNGEFGRYTRYSYTGAGACVVIRSGEKVLVIGCQTAEETKALYTSLAEKVQ